MISGKWVLQRQAHATGEARHVTYGPQEDVNDEDVFASATLTKLIA